MRTNWKLRKRRKVEALPWVTNLAGACQLGKAKAYQDKTKNFNQPLLCNVLGYKNL